MSNTVNAFYNCVDLTVTADGTNPGGGTPAAARLVRAAPRRRHAGHLRGPAWAATSTYTGGAKVSYAGNVYEAKWWTQNNVPGSEAWGPWKLIGAC